MNPEKIDPIIKKEINKEGFDENAAVLIGTKAELENLRARLESEGRAENLPTYLKMHKEIEVPFGAITNAQNCPEIGTAWVWGGPSEFQLIYVDKDKNIAAVRIKSQDITSLSKVKDKIGRIEEDLEASGFKVSDDPGEFTTTKDIIEKYKATLKQASAEEAKGGFDF